MLQHQRPTGCIRVEASLRLMNSEESPGTSLLDETGRGEMRSAPSTATLVAVMEISDLWLTSVQLISRKSRERR